MTTLTHQAPAGTKQAATASPVRAAVYLRVSTEEQREKQSIDTQRDFAERYCALHEIPVYAVYADDGVSGSIPIEKRPEGARLLQDAADGRFAMILVYNLRRFGRDTRHILNAVDELDTLGVQLKSMTEFFDTKDPAGRMFLTLLAGFGTYERETTIAQSINGSNRLARQGVWLGGIVPYGYRVTGKRNEARLTLSEATIGDLDLSEVDVIRLVFRMIGDEGRTCVAVADHLNAIGVPPAYTRDDRTIERKDALGGKRTERTSGIWRPSRIRNLVVNSTYKGIHQYGKRSTKRTETIEREVAPIVSVELWERAQRTLHTNQWLSTRNAKRQYLLRGLMKCGMCGLNYVGIAYKNRQYPEQIYYVCNGKHQYRGPYGLKRQTCPSKAVSNRIEAVIWNDVEGFLRNPEKVIDQLAERIVEQASDARDNRDRAAALQLALNAQTGEKDKVIGLFRRGRITESELDRQLDQIQKEEAEIRTEIAAYVNRAQGAETAGEQLRNAGDVLRELNLRLDEPLTWELKRQLLEILVGSIVVTTVEQDGKKEATVDVTYRFASTANFTDTRADNCWEFRTSYSGHAAALKSA